MDQEPQEQQEAPSTESGGKSGFFQNINGVIAGVTGLLVALAGLAATWDRIFPDKKADQEVVAKTDTVNTAAADTATEADASAPSDDDPWYFTTDNGGTIRWVDGLWVEEDKDGNKTRYDHFSADTEYDVAFLAGGGPEGEDVYLRWPKSGGRAQKSFDRQESWQDAYGVTKDAKQP